jgi:hypothetical protein
LTYATLTRALSLPSTQGNNGVLSHRTHPPPQRRCVNTHTPARCSSLSRRGKTDTEKSSTGWSRSIRRGLSTPSRRTDPILVLLGGSAPIGDGANRAGGERRGRVSVHDARLATLVSFAAARRLHPRACVCATIIFISPSPHPPLSPSLLFLPLSFRGGPRD